MTDYISREALKAAFDEDGHLSAYVEEMIDDIPAADVRPVVLCRDCKYSHPLMNSCKKCNYWSAHGLVIADHDFCSHGEKREES